MKKQQGFTLVELVITVVILGVILAALSPYFSSQVTAAKNTYAMQQFRNNVYVGKSLITYAANPLGTSPGVLPLPYTGGGYTSTVYNPGDVSANGLALSQQVMASTINPTQINDDGTAGASVRVYQLVSGLTIASPMYFRSGAVVTLTYQYGAVYMTACNKGDVSCNPNPVSGIPGASPVMTAANYATWKTTGTDLPAYTFSTLPLQRNMLTTTVQQLDELRDKFVSDFSANQITAIAGDATNWYPSGATSLSGKTPAINQGCRDGWYSLATSTVLANINVSTAKYAKTAWGGVVEFCRDYDATGTKLPNASPHAAAIRINVNVSAGVAPDAAVPGNNIVLTF